SKRRAYLKLLSLPRRRRCVDHVMVKFSVSERFACKVLGQHRSTQRKKPQSRPHEEALTTDIIRLAFIEPGSPWENGYCESFISKLRDELLYSEIFYSLAEAKV